jgi:integrase
MPIKLVPPRSGKTPYWSGRGTHFGQYVNRSTKARERSLARKVIRRWEREIERVEFIEPGEPTFASAALAYMRAGGERRFLTPLLRNFGETPLKRIGQADLDEAAATIYPNAAPATINRQLYTPAIAVLRRGGITTPFRRPAGAAGQQLTAWLWPEQANVLIEEAMKLDIEFGILCVVLLDTGLRLSEGLRSEIDRLRLDESYLYMPRTKNGEARAIFLPSSAIEALRAHPRGLDRPGTRIFKFHKGGHIYSLLRAAAARGGVTLQERQAFHIFCHTYATWMRRYGGLDLRGLVGTDRWKDVKSTARYAHVVPSEEARRAALLPGFGSNPPSSLMPY